MIFLFYSRITFKIGGKFKRSRYGAPDVKGAVVAGGYVENIKFEVEAAR